MDGGGVGELVGVAVVAVGVLVGWRYGPQAKKFERIVLRVSVGILAGILALFLGYVIWWAINN